jgi:hypothetical protein
MPKPRFYDLTFSAEKLLFEFNAALATEALTYALDARGGRSAR